MTQMVESGVTLPNARATLAVAPPISGSLAGAFVYGRGIPEPRPGDDEGSGCPGFRIALWLSFANKVSQG